MKQLMCHFVQVDLGDRQAPMVACHRAMQGFAKLRASHQYIRTALTIPIPKISEVIHVRY